ncbi:MAG: OmpA family protein [Longimicrobiales bacterium]|nr:OmpA family protein [Longimicrobiales bacterium]
MKRRSFLGIAVCLPALLLATAPAAAQNAGTLSLHGFAQFSLFDDATTLTQLPAGGVGGGFGFFVLPNLAVEGSAAYVPTELEAGSEDDVDLVPLRALLAYHLPLSETVRPFLGAGYTRYEYSDAIDASDDAFTALAGVKIYFSDRVALRLDGLLDYVSDPFNAPLGVSDHTNLTFSAGVSFDLGPGRSRDSDRDGVRDRDDACPGTPAGVAVDARGCRLDADRDGVYDEDDRCPGTPAGVRVDASGCRVDTDGDGVFDEEDRCADTPAGVRVDGAGCPVDTDRDGVADHQDACADTPAGVRVDARGCRVDADRDGVWDEDDRCPGTAVGTEVDVRGCAVLFRDESDILVLEGVTFATNSAELVGNSQDILDRVAESLVANPEVRIRVVGHTDSTGSRAYNVQLSQRRAEAVRDYLTTRGVAVDRMEAEGVGPDRPAASNDTEEGRRQNRRVELVRIGG